MGRAALMRSLMTSQCRRPPAMGVQLPMGTTRALLQKPCQRQAGSQACWDVFKSRPAKLAACCISRSACRATASLAGSSTPGSLCGRLCCLDHGRGPMYAGRPGIHSGLHTCLRVTAVLGRDLQQLCSQLTKERGKHCTCLRVTTVLDRGWLQMHRASVKKSKACGMPAGDGSARPGAVQ